MCFLLYKEYAKVLSFKVQLYKPNLNVPPLLTILALSSRIVITGLDVFSSNSVEDASFKFKTFLANSIAHNCMPKQIPKKGILLVLA